MARKDWLRLVAAHSDAWLYSVAFYYGAKLRAPERSGPSSETVLAVVRLLTFLGTPQGVLCCKHSALLRGFHSCCITDRFCCSLVVLMHPPVQLKQPSPCRAQLFHAMNQHSTLFEVINDRYAKKAMPPSRPRERREAVCSV